ncbi:MAG: response regulator FixJ [Alphaproteobacteria bacterium]
MPETPMVHLIDDDEAMRTSFSFLLDSAGLDNAVYASAEAFLELASDDARGCVITDIRMPGMSGMDLVAHLKSKGTKLPVIVITGHGDVPLAVEAMKNGVADFLEKPFDDEILLAAIHRALSDHGREGNPTGDSTFASVLATLSPRETEVLRGVVAGKANKIIAYELGISPRTVEVYRANVMAKTGAKGLSELVRMAMSAGF